MLSRTFVLNVCSEVKAALWIAERLRNNLLSKESQCQVIIVNSSGNQAKVVTEASALIAGDVSSRLIDRAKVTEWLQWRLVTIDALVNVSVDSQSTNGTTFATALSDYMKNGRGSVTELLLGSDNDNRNKQLALKIATTSQEFAANRIPVNGILCDVIKTGLDERTIINKDAQLSVLADKIWRLSSSASNLGLNGVTFKHPDTNPSAVFDKPAGAATASGSSFAQYNNLWNALDAI